MPDYLTPQQMNDLYHLIDTIREVGGGYGEIRIVIERGTVNYLIIGEASIKYKNGERVEEEQRK